jgi:hypothetical protein
MMKQYSRLAVVALVVLGFAAPARAQVPTVTGLKVDLARVASPTVVVATVTVPIASFTCNVAPTVLPTVTVNPDKVEYTDVLASTPTSPKVCRASITAAIAALAITDYLGTASFLYSDPGVIGGVSLASNPFSRFDPSTPLGLRFGR